jgi:hypothetical protein
MTNTADLEAEIVRLSHAYALEIDKSSRLAADVARLESHIASWKYIPLRYRDRPPGFIQMRHKICDTPHLCFEFGESAPICPPCDTAAVKAIFQENATKRTKQEAIDAGE